VAEALWAEVVWDAEAAYFGYAGCELGVADVGFAHANDEAVAGKCAAGKLA